MCQRNVLIFSIFSQKKTVLHFCNLWKYQPGREASSWLNWELPTSAMLLSLQLQHVFMFGTTFDYLVPHNPRQGNLPLRHTCSAQVLFLIKMCVCIRKGALFIPAWVEFILFFLSLEAVTLVCTSSRRHSYCWQTKVVAPVYVPMYPCAAGRWLGSTGAVSRGLFNCTELLPVAPLPWSRGPQNTAFLGTALRNIHRTLLLCNRASPEGASEILMWHLPAFAFRNSWQTLW